MKTPIAVPIISADPPLEQQVRSAVSAGAELLELRVDRIGDVEAVEALLRRPREVPFILTIRAAAEGGAWDGSEAERIALIQRLGLLLPGYIDVEYATWARSANVRQKIGLVCEGGDRFGVQGSAASRERSAVSGQGPGLTVQDPAGSRQGRARNRLILSHHDLNGTPANLDAVFDALAATPAAVIKCVFTARDATDSCRVLEQLRLRGDKRPMIALAMGEVGLMTRVLARRFSAFLTFASCEAGLPSAPGQPTIAELRECYHWDQIDADTRVYGVIGWPVTHSRSPHIHNAAMRADRMNAVYVPVPVAPTYEDLAAFLDYVVAHPRLEFRGFSVTIPHKEHTLRWIEQRGADATALARRCGAVNTLARSGDRWVGDNTDAPAMLDALATVPGLSREELSGRRIAILGAGGAARAAAVALRDGECDVTLLNRTDARAQALAATIGCEAQPWSERIRGDCDILINCTSAGMSPRSEETPFPAEALRPEMIVFDTVYNPVETRLLREARAAGCRTISGIEMFVAQAAAQYRRWHRTEASREIMRAALSK